MLGFLDMFGPSREMQRLDQAVRAVGLHPRLVPQAVKLTILNLLKEANNGASPAPRAYYAAAEMLGFCMLGPTGFTEANDLHLTEATEARLEAAIEAGDGVDARLVLLALHAGIIQAQVVERYQIEAS
jgi:hypothetical protein